MLGGPDWASDCGWHAKLRPEGQGEGRQRRRCQTKWAPPRWRKEREKGFARGQATGRGWEVCPCNVLAPRRPRQGPPKEGQHCADVEAWLCSAAPGDKAWITSQGP